LILQHPCNVKNLNKISAIPIALLSGTAVASDHFEKRQEIVIVYSRLSLIRTPWD